jgi:hypothetical protein
MRTYVVTFERVLASGAPRERRVIVRQVLVPASSAVAACWDAKAMLRDTMGVIDWRMVADACTAAALSEVVAA